MLIYNLIRVANLDTPIDFAFIPRLRYLPEVESRT